MDPAKPSFKEALRELARRRERELEVHPSPDELVAYLDGELSGPERERLRDHLAVCRPCAGLVRDLAALPDLEVPEEAARHLEDDVEAGWEALQNRLRGGEPKERRRTGWPLLWLKPTLPFAIGFAASVIGSLLGTALMAFTFVRLHSRAALLLLGLTSVAGGLGWAVPEGVPIEGARQIAERIEGAEVHTYRVPLRKGDFVRAAVDQRGVDVKVTWWDPAGRRVLGRDAFWGALGVEEAPLLAEQSGDHLLQIGKVARFERAGWYRLEVSAARRPTVRDRLRFAASVAFSRAYELWCLDSREALPAYQNAYDRWGAAGDPAQQAEALYWIGRIHRSRDQPEQALQAYRRAWRPWQGTPIGQGYLLNAMGLAHRQAGRLTEALDHFERAQQLGARRNLLVVETSAWQNLAGEYRKQGEFQRARDAFQRAEILARRLGNARTRSVVASDLGNLYLLLGQFEQAREAFRQALELARTNGDPALVAASRRNLSKAALQMGQLERARQVVEALLGETMEADAELLNLRGLVALRQQDPAARAWFEEARRVAAKEGLKAEEAEALANLGYFQGIDGERELSRQSFDRAAAHYQGRGDLAALALLRLGRSRVSQSSGDLARALAEVESSVELVETMRANPWSVAVRQSFLARRHSAYRARTEVLMDLHALEPAAGHDERALTAAETARARTLLEALVVRGGKLAAEADPELLDREREAAGDLREGSERLMRLLAQPGRSAEVGAQESRVEELKQRLETVQEAIARSDPRYADLVRPRPLTVAEIRDRVLDDDTLLLAYQLGEERSLWWLLGRGLLVSGDLPGEQQINDLARAAHRELSRPVRQGAGPRFSPALDRLGEVLLGPVAPHLGSKRLLVVPDGALHYVPFAALPDPADRRRPLVERAEVVVLPSASVLDAIRRQMEGRPRPAGQVAVLADPVFSNDDPRVRPPLWEQWGRTAPVPIPAGEALRSARSFGVERLDRLTHSRAEAEAILALVPAGQRLSALDFAASRTTATGPRLGRYRIVHFATHGLFNPGHPHLSGIFLSQVDPRGRPQDGFLAVSEIYELDLPVDLVVLSACQTALGADVRGEGLVGLTRGFLYAGASRVVVSLWSVDDRATAELMKRFYRAMLLDQLPPAAALRAAQRALRREGEWSAPYHWAAFVLQGEWR